MTLASDDLSIDALGATMLTSDTILIFLTDEARIFRQRGESLICRNLLRNSVS